MSYGMTGGYSSMAEAVGEAPWQQAGYEPSHVFTGADIAEIVHDDGYDDGMAIVRHITEADAARTLTRLERENARLRERIAELEAGDDADADGWREGGEDAWLDAHMEDVLSGGYDSWGE